MTATLRRVLVFAVVYGTSVLISAYVIYRGIEWALGVGL